jgi:DNA-binding response OmpR family regulator
VSTGSTGTARSKPISRILSAERPNTLGLGPTELSALLDFLDGDDTHCSKARREYARWPFRHVGLNVVFEHPGGGAVTLRLAGRNISGGGVALLHNGFLHPGTACRVALPRHDGSIREVTGRIVRCAHRRGMLHEICIRFDKPIDVRQFARARPGEEFHTLERVDPAKLTGSVVYVEDNALDAKIVHHFLRETAIKLRVCATCSEGLEAAANECDLLLVDHELPDMLGTAFLRQARERGIVAPAIILTAKPAESMEGNLWAIPDVGFIRKPFTQDHLLRILAERLLLRNGESQSARAAETTQKNGGAQLSSFAYLIEEGVKAGDVRALGEVLLRLEQQARSLGATQIADAAHAARDTLAKKDGLQDRTRLFLTLADLCRR